MAWKGEEKMIFKSLLKIRTLLEKELKNEEKMLQLAREKKERELANKDSDWNTDEGIELLRKTINSHIDRVVELQDLIKEIDETELK